MSDAEMGKHIDTVVIGGGQAGLSASWYLTRSGREHVILDRGMIGDSWRRRWDSFCLVTPNWLCQLPGFPYDGDDPDGFMERDEIVSYVERFASSFGPPFRGGVDVRRLRASKDVGRFSLDSAEGTLNAENVIVATGPFQRPDFPAWKGKLGDDIKQIHTDEYRNASELPNGAILVVGSGQSGAQIAEDLYADGREVHLCVGRTGHTVRQYRGRDLVDWMWDSGMIDVPIHQHPEGPEIRFRPMPLNSGRGGGHAINLRKLALDGIKLHGRALDADRHMIRLASDLRMNLDAADVFLNQVRQRIDAYIERDGIQAPSDDIEPVDWQPEPEGSLFDLKQAGITCVIFGTGYRFEFDWIDLPVFDDVGYPRYDRGVTEVPGLYFIGLHWLHTLGSGTFGHVGRDAKYVVEQISRGI